MDEDGILPHLDVQQRDFENWVGKLDGIKEVLEPYYSNPQAARLVLEKFLQGNIQKAPPFIATMISGGRVEEIINIGTVSNLIIKLVLPPTPVFLKQLPPAIPNFTGRLEEQKKLVDEITRPITPGDQPRILSLVGMGGVGKSSLAIQVAHQVKGYFPDGQLYVDLHGAPGSQPLTPEDVLGGFLRAMGVEDRHIPRNLQLRASNFRSILDGKQVLIVLDNARDEAQIRPLRPSNPNCVVLVTSRKSLTALSCTTEIHLDVLPVAEGIALLEKLVDDDRVTAERGSAEEIVFLVGQLPLAIRIAGGKLKSRRRLTLKEYAADLAIHRGDLQHLQLADLDVRTCIDISYQDLKPELARLFRFLGLLAGVSFTPEVAAVLIDVEPNLICEKLEDLEDINLLEWAGENRYRFHDLVRAFAREKVANDPINEQQAARERAMRWYLKTSAEKNELLQAMVYKKGATVEVAKLGYSRADGGQNLDEVLSWFEAERKNLLAAMDWGFEMEKLSEILEGCRSLTSYLNIRGYWNDWARIQEIALRAARKSENEWAEASTLTGLGAVYRLQGRWNEALRKIKESLHLWEQIKDRGGEALAKAELGLVFQLQGHREEAANCLKESLVFYIESENKIGESMVRNLLGNLYRLQGNLDGALTMLKEGLAINRRLGNRYGESISLNLLGNVYRIQSQWDEAINLFQESLAINLELGNRYGMTICYGSLGNVYREQGRWEAAIDKYTQSIRLGEALGDLRGTSITLNGLGRVYTKMEQFEEAREAFEKSLKICRDLGIKRGENIALRVLGEIQAKENLDQGIAMVKESLLIARDLGDKRCKAQSLNSLGILFTEKGNWQEAERALREALQYFEETHNPHGQAEVKMNLGILFHRQGRLIDAIPLWEEAIATKELVGTPEYSELLRLMANTSKSTAE